MCLQPVAGNDYNTCNDDDTPSFVIYGDRTVSTVELKSTPMMTSAQINASAEALSFSNLTRDRLQVSLTIIPMMV